MTKQTGFSIVAGDPALLGASHCGNGYNFALFSANASAVELCLFDASGHTELARLTLPDCDNGVWSGFVPQLTPPFTYGYRVHGPWAPESGHRFNPNKLLFDPYARDVLGEFQWHPSAQGEQFLDGHSTGPCNIDSAPHVPKALVRAHRTVERARPCAQRISWPRTLVWEAHVRGATITHPAVASAQRGRFSGLSSPPMIDYLKAHGISTVELMPVQSIVTERHLHQRNLINYWGYNPLGFFAFNPSYAHEDPSAEFSAMVNAFHDAGIEVVLDVVYNHSCESDKFGPTLSYRGIDNASYYSLLANDPSDYVNDTGCGNTFNADSPIVQRLVRDNLRWLASLGIDGFRFDLGVTLGRNPHGFNSDSPLWRSIINDPQLAGRKLFSEPWDIGPGGYQLGGMAPPIAEWNDRYRDTLRRAWRGESGQLPDLARRLHGSADVFETRHRPPHCSVNYIASHDGASLSDLVSYVGRHNEANGEDNRDGHHDNLSQNFGIEGPSDATDVNQQRGATMRGMLATLLVSQGVPMLTAGDEWGHSRQGNNNAYCQDNVINWLDWEQSEQDAFGLRRLLRRLSEIRREFPEFWVDRWRHQADDDVGEGIDWFHPRGDAMTDADWQHSELRAIVMRIVAGAGTEAGAQQLLVALNVGASEVEVTLPSAAAWRRLLNTADIAGFSDALDDQLPFKGDTADDVLLLTGRSVQIFVAN